jgi:tetratricopeptide (TPR) repeat protein
MRKPFSLASLIILFLGLLPLHSIKGQEAVSIAQFHYSLGNLYSDEERLDEAVIEYKKALEYNPNLPQAEDNLGFMLYKKGDYKEALTHYQRAITLMPDYAIALNNIGVIYYHFKDYDEAASFYQQAIKLKPDYAKAHFNLAATYFRQGRYLSALSQYRKVRKINERYVEERTDCQRLEAELKKAIQDDQDNPELKAMLAQLRRFK